jgi:hypothetical protein
MCGSGTVAGAFSHLRPTYASDAQGFCELLARVQGGGYSLERAGKVLDQLDCVYEDNKRWLLERLAGHVEAEERFLNSAMDEAELADAYAQFVSTFPLFPDGAASPQDKWNPVSEVKIRQQSEPFSMPSCLFSTYYANLFVGVRQAIEIDSIRHAISTLSDQLDRAWSLGTLTVVVSSIASGYAKHYAQPYFTPERLRAFSADKENPRRILYQALLQRRRSVNHELRARFMSLANASEERAHVIRTFSGPWLQALDEFDQIAGHRAIVYVDAPYKRDEYSRYYHLLETLVQYNYPAVAGKGRLPAKGDGGRFSSEFASRVHSRVVQAHQTVINEILERGFDCAWSYADSGQVRAVDIIEGLPTSSRFVCSVSAPHSHKGQGRFGRSKPVTEQLFMFRSHHRS